MLSEQLLTELHKLNPAEKLRVIQILVNELASADAPSETLIQHGAEYEVWSPYDAFEAANTLQTMLYEYVGM